MPFSTNIRLVPTFSGSHNMDKRKTQQHSKVVATFIIQSKMQLFIINKQSVRGMKKELHHWPVICYGYGILSTVP
jgi:hypothetical protein